MALRQGDRPARRTGADQGPRAGHVSGRVGTVTSTVDVPDRRRRRRATSSSSRPTLLFAPRDGQARGHGLGPGRRRQASPATEADAASRPHRVLVARLEDGAGRTVEQLTHEWSERWTHGEVGFRGSLAAGAGRLHPRELDPRSRRGRRQRRAARPARPGDPRGGPEQRGRPGGRHGRGRRQRDRRRSAARRDRRPSSRASTRAWLRAQPSSPSSSGSIPQASSRCS